MKASRIKSLPYDHPSKIVARTASLARYYRLKEAGKPHSAATPEHARRSNLKKYGITPEEYDALNLWQKGVCAICTHPETFIYGGRVLPLSVDHNHQTGRTRGLLCRACNIGLGLFKDNPVSLQNALTYLESNK